MNQVRKMVPYRKSDYDEGQWPIHVVYDELREEQVEGYIHPWGFNRHQRRTLLGAARRRPRRVRDPRDLTHRRGTQGGRLFTKEERGIE